MIAVVINVIYEVDPYCSDVFGIMYEQSSMMMTKIFENDDMFITFVVSRGKLMITFVVSKGKVLFTFIESKGNVLFTFVESEGKSDVYLCCIQRKSVAYLCCIEGKSDHISDASSNPGGRQLHRQPWRLGLANLKTKFSGSFFKCFYWWRYSPSYSQLDRN